MSNLKAVKKYQSQHPDRVRESRIKRLYGINNKDFEAMLAVQEHRCAICAERLGKETHIDHSHATGKVRGILCGTCNRGLGQFKDSEALLFRAQQYLRTHS